MDDHRLALKFLLAFACSRTDKELESMLLSKYKKMMNEELTSWWVDGVDSAYRGIKDFMVSNHTFLSRVAQFRGEYR